MLSRWPKPARLSAYEIAVLRDLPAAVQIQGFFNCWTRKEAYLKATGDGLVLPLDQFDVSLTPGAPAELLRVAGDANTSHWVLQELNVGCGYAAAVAIRSSRPIETIVRGIENETLEPA